MKDNIKQFTNALNIDDDKESLPDIKIDTLDIHFNEDIKMDIYDDYKYNRIKLINMIQSADGILKHALIDMKNNPGPRSIEASTALIKVVGDMSEKIFNLHEKMKKFQKEDKNEKEPEESENDKPQKLKASITEIIDNLPDHDRI